MRIMSGIKQPDFRNPAKPAFGLIMPGFRSDVKSAFGLITPGFRGTATLPKIENGPASDRLELSTAKPAAGKPAQAPTSVGQALKQLLSPGPERRETAAALLKAVTDKLPPGVRTPELNPARQAKVDALADSIRNMSDKDRLNLIREVTGQGSPFGKMVEKAVATQQPPGLKDWLTLARPKPPQTQGSSLAGTAIQAASLGLLMLSVAAPAALVAQPNLINPIVTTLALKVL